MQIDDWTKIANFLKQRDQNHKKRNKGQKWQIKNYRSKNSNLA